MNTQQFKNRYLKSEIQKYLSLAQWCAKVGARKNSVYWAERALSFARQLPDNPTNRTIRASIVAAIETGKKGK